MRYQTKVIVVSLIAAALVLPLVGCTLIGYSIGSMIDSGKPARKQVPGWGWRNINHGEQLTVILMSGVEDSGRFVSVCDQEHSDYAVRFAKRVSNSTDWPRPGEQFTIFTKRDDSIPGTLIGYDQRYGYDPSVRQAQASDSQGGPSYLTGMMVFSSEGVREARRVDCRAVGWVRRGDGVVVTGAAIAAAVTDRRLPCLTSLVLKTPAETKMIPVDDIEQVWARNHRHAKTTGLVLGAVVDVTVITVAIIASTMDFGMGDWGGSSYSGGDGAYSCPFVYAYDGTKYHRQAEVFGGAIFKGAQRTDWVTLDSLKPVGDICRVRITNELDETQYVDELSLLAVDHPVGSHVVPSFDGGLHVINGPLAPQAARSDNGADQTAAVANADDRIWISNPFGRDATQMSQVRDGLELSFPKQPGDTAATIVVRGKNTRWSAEMLAEVLRLQGDSLEAWYQMLNSSEQERGRLARAMIREGMLQVKVWAGNGWCDAGMIWDVGPAVPREVAVRLANLPTGGRTLRVRLESTAGFWMIDRVSVCYHATAPSQVTRITARRASDQLGKSRVAALGEVDGSYYEMPTTLDCTELEFRVPPRAEHLERSYVIQCNGYYTIHVQRQGTPDPALMTRLLDEPGAYGRYTLELLDLKVREALAANDSTAGH